MELISDKEDIVDIELVPCAILNSGKVRARCRRRPIVSETN